MLLTNTDDRPDKGRYRGLRRDLLAHFAFAPPFERTRAARSVPCPRIPRNPFFRRARKCGPLSARSNSCIKGGGRIWVNCVG